jgi:hypothetical protein
MNFVGGNFASSNFNTMGDNGYDDFNSFAELAVHQNLLLWKTTAALLEMDATLAKHRKGEDDLKIFGHPKNRSEKRRKLWFYKYFGWG